MAHENPEYESLEGVRHEVSLMHRLCHAVREALADRKTDPGQGVIIPLLRRAHESLPPQREVLRVRSKA